jgi:hypothetical protein
MAGWAGSREAKGATPTLTGPKRWDIHGRPFTPPRIKKVITSPNNYGMRARLIFRILLLYVRLVHRSKGSVGQECYLVAIGRR